MAKSKIWKSSSRLLPFRWAGASIVTRQKALSKIAWPATTEDRHSDPTNDLSNVPSPGTLFQEDLMSQETRIHPSTPLASDLSDHPEYIPFAEVPASDDPRRGQEVMAPNGPFEAPAKEFVPGPYYMDADERFPELATRAPSQQSAEGTSPFSQENGSQGPGFSVGRRDFMKLFSATAVGATAACVQRPVEHGLPYVDQPVDQYPGEAVWYASTCGDCTAGCGVMVRTREGRPTKVEGLPGHKVNEGKLCSVGQASLHGLWHPERRPGPEMRFGQAIKKVTWPEVYEHLGSRIQSSGGKVAIFTGGATGNRHGFYREWLTHVGSQPSRLYTFESNSLIESTLAAHKIAFGVDGMPHQDLSKAELIVGIGSDFLDVGTSLVSDTKGYMKSHSFRDGKKGRHVQLESVLTLTGSKADERFVIPPGSETVATLLLVRALFASPMAKGSAQGRIQIQQALDTKTAMLDASYERLGLKKEAFDKIAEELLSQPSVVLCGGSANFDENTTNLQLAAIMANELIGAYDNVLHLQKGLRPAPVNPGDLSRFLAEIQGIDVLIVIDSNPLFSIPASWGIGEALKGVKSVVSLQEFPNEVDDVATYRLPNHHWLESWGDEQPRLGYWSLRQPTVRPTHDSRQAEDVLLWVAATMKKPMGYADYRAYLMKKWAPIHQTLDGTVAFDTFFNNTLRAGTVGQELSTAIPALSAGVGAALKLVETPGVGFRLISPLDIRLRDGRHAHKPVLQEASESLTTIAWDSYVALNPKTVAQLGLKKFDLVKIQGPVGVIEAAVYPLPGLHPEAVLVPRGNGHGKGRGTIEGGTGVDPLLLVNKAQDALTGSPAICGQLIKITPTGIVYPLAQLQKHNDIANRKDIVKKVSLKAAQEKPVRTKELDDVPDLYPALPKLDYRWGMSIDLDKCTGCQACYVACTLENNVAMVGREQILLGREMNWIRIDRYFWGNPDNPEVTMQPMLCQHCNHAPCEAVCPMYATTHDPEGINAMTYNRCIGTKYCANACPYKIRRFNWWTHKWNVLGNRLQDRSPRALNPDVTVRTKGVMEKCTFCYQRIRDAKHKAKIAGRLVKDQEFLPACAQTCPAEAISFGNLHDPASMITQDRKDGRAYLALGGDPDHGHYGIKTLPNVSYKARVTLKEVEGESSDHGKHHG